MLDIGWPEMLLVLVLALMVIGPADLPKAMYGLGKAMRKMRMMSRAFQDSLDELMREAEIEDIKKEAQAAQQSLIEDIDIEDDMQDVMTAGRIDFDDDGTTPDLVDTERDADPDADDPQDKPAPKKKKPAAKKKPAPKKKTSGKKAASKKGGGK